MEKLIHGTADFKAQKKAFDESVSKFKVVSSRDILYDSNNELVDKINLSLAMWCHTSSTKYFINYLCEKLGFIYRESDIDKICFEVEHASNENDLSEEVSKELYDIADTYISYCEETFEKYDDIYRQKFAKKLNADSFVYGLINHDEEFFIDYFASVFDMSDEELNKFYTHVFKRRSVNYFDKNEFLVWLSAKISTGFNYPVLCELRDLYSSLKKEKDTFDDDEEDITVDITDTYCIGENVEELFLSKITGEISYKELKDNPVISKVLLWHINLPSHDESSAGKRFRELFNEVNELYKDEISDELTAKRSDNTSIEDKKDASEKVEYKKKKAYPKVVISYSSDTDISVDALSPVLFSKGRFNRVEGKNEFGFVNDTVLPAGEHEVEVEVKIVSERPFQMERLRKSGMIEVAASSNERRNGDPLPDHILKVSESFAKNFNEITVKSRKPICIPATEFVIGDIRSVLFSKINKVEYSHVDLIVEENNDKNSENNDKSQNKISVAKLVREQDKKIPINVEYLKSEWFLRTIINDEIVKNYEKADGYEQRSAFELMLFLKYIKEELPKFTDKTKLEKSFIRVMNYELEQVRFEGIHMGNPFDLLLTYLIKMDEPDLILKALYAEVF